MINIDFWRKHTNNKDIWLSLLAALMIANAVLFLYMLITKQEKGGLVIQPIPQEDFKTEGNLVINTPKNDPKQPQRAYIASKNGGKYYDLNCSAATKIVTENRIWFSSEQEAESSGYTKSKKCD